MTKIDDTLVGRTMREGGALVTVTVDTLGQHWMGEMLVAGLELRESYLSRSEIIQLRAKNLVESIDVERGTVGT
jgi:hypothetical protein